MSYAKIYSLKPADRVVTQLFHTGITKHYAIYLGYDGFGQEIIAENDFADGVRIIKASIFFNEHLIINRVDHFIGSDFQRHQAVLTAKALVGKSYDLFLYNCEHYANQVQHGRAESNQVQVGVLLGTLFCLYLLIRD